MLLDVSLDVAWQHDQVHKDLAMTNCSPLLVWEDVDVLVNVSQLNSCKSMTFLLTYLANTATSLKSLQKTVTQPLLLGGQVDILVPVLL